MRSRNIKPGFFKNDQLAECPVEARLLFAGLWCMADRAGRLEDRPKRIKMELFPADSFDVDALLTILDKQGLIQRYQVGENRYIQVIEFAKHQHPHQKEPPSTIPEPGASTVQAPDKSGAATMPARLIPDSRSLIPDSSLRETHAREDEVEHAEWEATKALYPPNPARSDWIGAERAARKLVEDGLATWETLRAGVIRYAALCRATDRMVLNPAKFFTDHDRPWSQAWPIPPPKKSFAQSQQDGVAARFLGTGT
jgi:hypothetical protein